MLELLKSNVMLDTVYYEEPFIGYAEAAKNLLMLRTFLEELIVENEPELDYIKHFEINNMKWKKLFLAPDKCPAGTSLQKEAVRKKLEGYMPFLNVVTQDEIDAISMGFVAAAKLNDGESDELESKKKVHPFKYNIQFIGADKDDDMFVELFDICKCPQIVMSNGILFTIMSNIANFDKHVYQNMGSDDKLLIVRFNSGSHGDLVLRHKIGRLAADYDYIYAIVWRKSRKDQ